VKDLTELEKVLWKLISKIKKEKGVFAEQ